MEGRSAGWILAVLLLEALISVEAQNSLIYLEVGGKLVLIPESVSGSITSISWKFNEGIVGEWNAETLPLDFTSAYRGRSSVDTNTGELEISDMMKTDSGLYTVEINNNIQDRGYDVKVIQQVPKPEVMITPLTCVKESKSCSLSCGGDITEAGPVSFYFKKGDGDWEEREQNIEIMNDATTQAVETFSCRMKNPLGEKDSEPVKNPFYVLHHVPIVEIVIGLLAAVGVVVGSVFVGRYLINKEKSGSRTDAPAAAPSPNNNTNHPEGTPLKDSSPDSKENV